MDYRHKDLASEMWNIINIIVIVMVAYPFSIVPLRGILAFYLGTLGRVDSWIKRPEFEKELI